MANHTTQMMNAHPEKKIRVNQSIKADTLRRKVGSAKAPNVANGGKAKSMVLSAVGVNKEVVSASEANHSGNTTW
jgi:hypothetical protein